MFLPFLATAASARRIPVGSFSIDPLSVSAAASSAAVLAAERGWREMRGKRGFLRRRRAIF